MEKLKSMRIKKGYTHADMAKLLNISKPFYWQIENNKRRLSYNMAFNISQILKQLPTKFFMKNLKIIHFKRSRLFCFFSFIR